MERANTKRGLLSRNDFFWYQKLAHRFAMKRLACALWLDMGLGKTATVLTVIQDLAHDWGLHKALVIAPLRVARSVWQEETEEWKHLQGMKVVKVLGTPAQRRAALAQDADVYVINFENLLWLFKEFKADWPFDFVCVDEASRLRSHEAKAFTLLKLLRKHKKIRRFIELTGTPAPKSYENIWSQMYLLDECKTLNAPTLGEFRRQHFNARKNAHGGYDYTLIKGREKKIQEKLKPLVLSIKVQREKEFRKNVIKIRLNDKDQQAYNEMQRDYILGILEEHGVTDIEAVNAGVLKNKLQQLASGNIYHTNEETGVRRVIKLHDKKLDVLESVMEEHPGEQILIAYNFNHERDAIKRRFPNVVDMNDVDDIENRWNKGEFQYMMGHPASIGHGLNLHKGGARILCWYGLTWDLELFLQMNKRLDRTGQVNEGIIHILAMEGTVDEQIIKRLFDRDITQDDLMKAVMRFATRGSVYL